MAHTSSRAKPKPLCGHAIVLCWIGVCSFPLLIILHFIGVVEYGRSDVGGWPPFVAAVAFASVCVFVISKHLIPADAAYLVRQVAKGVQRWVKP
jgi:hypothetical protein